MTSSGTKPALTFRVFVASLAGFSLLANPGLGTMTSQMSQPTATGIGEIPGGWEEITSNPRPQAMAGGMMAYSSKDRRFVLFGGWDGTRGLNETWLFDVANGTWTLLHPPVSPIERGDAMFVYDSRADVFVLFGGWFEHPNETYSRLGDTWTFSLSTVTWTERHPARSPSPRSDPQVAHDPAMDEVLLFGGFDGTYLGDVWSYSVANDTWTPRPSAAQPPPRADGRLVYVPPQDRHILFGGNDYHGPNFTFHHLSDTWTYDWSSNEWTMVQSVPAPSARDYPIFVHDPAANMLLLTAGYGNWTILNDVWAFDLRTDTWSDVSPDVEMSPPPRFAAAGDFDATHGVLVLFGGLGNDGLLQDTWYYRHPISPDSPGGLSSIVLLGLSAAAIVSLAVVVGLGMSRKRWPRRRR